MAYRLDVIAIGEGMVEFVARTRKGLSKAKSFLMGWGGDTSNTLIALSRLGKKAGYITRIGDDEFGLSLLNMWDREGIDTSFVRVEKGGRTGIYFVSLLKNGGHEFIYYRSQSPASRLSLREIDPSYISSARILHFSGITQAIGEGPRRAVKKAARIAKRSGVLVSYDPNFRPRLWSIGSARPKILEAIREADIALPSLDDGRLITGLKKPEDVAHSLIEEGPRIVALKLGSDGCLVATKDEAVRVEAFGTKVLDTTGAGDAFNAGFLAGLLESRSLEDAARLGNLVAALKTSHLGATRGLPYRGDVERLMTRQAKILRIADRREA